MLVGGRRVGDSVRDCQCGLCVYRSSPLHTSSLSAVAFAHCPDCGSAPQSMSWVCHADSAQPIRRGLWALPEPCCQQSCSATCSCCLSLSHPSAYQSPPGLKLTDTGPLHRQWSRATTQVSASHLHQPLLYQLPFFLFFSIPIVLFTLTILSHDYYTSAPLQHTARAVCFLPAHHQLLSMLHSALNFSIHLLCACVDCRTQFHPITLTLLSKSQHDSILPVLSVSCLQPIAVPGCLRQASASRTCRHCRGRCSRGSGG